MRRISYRKYFLLAAALFVVLAVPAWFVEGVRVRVIAVFSPALKMVHKPHTGKEERLLQLEAENHLLRAEVGKLRGELEQEALAPDLPTPIAAHVIFRDAASWTSALWVDVGGEAIKKNSPVVVGRSVVGVVDHVGKKQSRIRLITDTALKPSVRAVRGLPQNAHLAEHITPILHQIAARTDLPLTKEERIALYRQLDGLKNELKDDLEGHYLAKGVVQGAGTPLWRSVNSTLKGVGFNYDFPDAKGDARTLVDDPDGPILKVGDLLVTTGMDGVFPAGLCVAEVTKLYPLREGAYTYDLDAAPCVGNLDSLQTVFILPPLGYQDDEGD